MTIFRDFQGSRRRRDIGIARPRHSKTCLETSSSEANIELQCWEQDIMGNQKLRLFAIVWLETILKAARRSAILLDLEI